MTSIATTIKLLHVTWISTFCEGLGQISFLGRYVYFLKEHEFILPTFSAP